MLDTYHVIMSNLRLSAQQGCGFLDDGLHVINTDDSQDIPSHPHALSPKCLQGHSNHNESNGHLKPGLDEQSFASKNVSCPPGHIGRQLQPVVPLSAWGHIQGSGRQANRNMHSLKLQACTQYQIVPICKSIALHIACTNGELGNFFKSLKRGLP